MLVQLLDHFVSVNAVYGTGISQGLAACGGAAQAVHAHLEEVDSSGTVEIEDIADTVFFGNDHDKISFHVFSDILLLYSIRKNNQGLIFRNFPCDISEPLFLPVAPCGHGDFYDLVTHQYDIDHRYRKFEDKRAYRAQ